MSSANRRPLVPAGSGRHRMRDGRLEVERERTAQTGSAARNRGGLCPSREPVGSKALVERHHLGVSSATIRNDMAALEEEGLITAPHTSAGRIPTDKGYRLFVDRISAVKPLSAAERRAIQALLEGSKDLDDVAGPDGAAPGAADQPGRRRAVPAAGPRHGTPHRVRAAGAAEGTDGPDRGHRQGGTAHRSTSARTLDEDAVARAAKPFLASGCAAPRWPCCRRHLAGRRGRVASRRRPPAQRAARGLEQLAAAAARTGWCMAGTANLARSNVDFPLSIGPVLDALEEQVVMLRLLCEMAAGPARSGGEHRPGESV